MTDPVDTDALRKTARKAGSAIAAAALNGGRIQMRVPADPDSDTDLLVTALECDALAAADEVDRLRMKVEHQRAVNRRNIDAMTGEHDRLRAVIVNAPHQLDCSTQTHASVCDCWKADVL